MAPRRIALIVGIVLLAPLLLVAGAVMLAQSEWGERWLEKQVSSRIHREVQVEGIRLHFGWPPAVSFERLRIGNPEWATTKDLLDANGLLVRVDVPALFHRRILLPYLQARVANAGLEQSAGRATWKFGEQERNPSRIELARVLLEDGHVVYRDEDEDTALDVKVKGSFGANGKLEASATGKFRGEPTKGTASLPGLEAALTDPVQATLKADVGRTRVAGEGRFATDLQSIDMKFRLAGQTLKDLHKVLGIVLPDTPPYTLAGRLRHEGNDWVFDPFDGKVGDSDLRGAVTYVKGGARPLFRGNLQSKLLDFDDLGPLVGAPPKTGPGETASPEQRAKAAQLQASTHVLPREPFSTARWGEMDADVHLTATRVQRPRQLPIESLSTHIVLKDRVMTLDPLDFGVASGHVKSRVAIDSRTEPPIGDLRADVQEVKLAKLFPALKSMEEAFGTVYGRADLKGRGASVGDLLATSNGTMALSANGGRVSDLLVQLLEIDVAHAAMLLGTRKQQVDLRCAVGTFNVKQGVVSPESFVVDTTETNVKVTGTVNLGEERLDIVARGEGKSPSLLVLKSPVVLEGPLKKPSVHPRAGPIVAQGAAAAALAAVNPALAIAPFVSSGKGKDADCDTLLAEARRKGAVDKTKTAAR
jgi:uncharacterized protein involved in outer membrane biogenesis